MKNNLTHASKFLSLILRHNPQAGNITLDSNGWAITNKVLDALRSKGYTGTQEFLDEIVSTDNKQRYGYSDDKSLIRANQGHSVEVDLSLVPKIPPDILYHGTAEKSVPSIMASELRSGSRQYVHLSRDIPTATSVGSRHGKPHILEINAKAMTADGFEFFCSKNNVWLTKVVPSKYVNYPAASSGASSFNGVNLYTWPLQSRLKS